jgi:site-specific DNA-methyltransferase (adenine-specific)
LNQAYCEIIQQRLAEPEAPVRKRAGSARKKDKAAVAAGPETVIPGTAGNDFPTQAGIQVEQVTHTNLGPRLRGESSRAVPRDDDAAANEQNIDNAIQGTTP